MGLFSRKPWSPRVGDVVRLPGWGPDATFQIRKVAPDGLHGYFYEPGLPAVRETFMANVNDAGETRVWERVKG